EGVALALRKQHCPIDKRCPAESDELLARLELPGNLRLLHPCHAQAGAFGHRAVIVEGTLVAPHKEQARQTNSQCRADALRRVERGAAGGVEELDVAAGGELGLDECLEALALSVAAEEGQPRPAAEAGQVTQRELLVAVEV